MTDRHMVAWLGRKVAWGFAPGQLDDWAALGAEAVIDQLVDPDANAIAARPDPFAEIDVTAERQGRVLRDGTLSWIENAVTSPRPLETFMEFFWSDYFAVSARVVRPRYWMFDHMNLLGEHSLGNMRDLLRAVTIDPSMLDFLDGRRSNKGEPNENYGRELLELYSVGVGEFTEDDVKAAATALTGWKVQRATGQVRLRNQRHDDTPQTLLGVDGVHDLDTTIDAVLAHPATARRIVDKLAEAILGSGYPADVVDELAPRFAETWELKPVVRRLLERGVDGDAQASILEPLAWYVGALRATQARPRQGQVRQYFRLAAQLPLQPPNVGGFPSTDAYLSTSATIARFNMASHLAALASQGDRSSVTDLTRDLDQLAEHFGLIDGFELATRDALDSLSPGADRLAAVLASPDVLVVDPTMTRSR